MLGSFPDAAFPHLALPWFDMTRARQGMVLFVPPGEPTDPTRAPAFYDVTFTNPAIGKRLSVEPANPVVAGAFRCWKQVLSGADQLLDVHCPGLKARDVTAWGEASRRAKPQDRWRKNRPALQGRNLVPPLQGWSSSANLSLGLRRSARLQPRLSHRGLSALTDQ